MAEKRVSGTVHIHVDDINSCKTLLAYTTALNYKYSLQSDKDIRRSVRRRYVMGEARIVTDEMD